MRYILQKSEERPLWWTLTDVENGIVCRFKEGEFNETQKFTLLDDVDSPNPTKLASLVNEMSEWLRDNHYEIIFTSPTLIKEETRMKIGAALRKIREEKGYSSRHLAKLTGIAYNHICRIERGKYNVNLDTLAIICNTLGVSLEILKF